jgi:hypothetical protein
MPYRHLTSVDAPPELFVRRYGRRSHTFAAGIQPTHRAPYPQRKKLRKSGLGFYVASRKGERTHNTSNYNTTPSSLFQSKHLKSSEMSSSQTSIITATMTSEHSSASHRQRQNPLLLMERSSVLLGILRLDCSRAEHYHLRLGVKA